MDQDHPNKKISKKVVKTKNIQKITQSPSNSEINSKGTILNQIPIEQSNIPIPYNPNLSQIPVQPILNAQPNSQQVFVYNMQGSTIQPNPVFVNNQIVPEREIPRNFGVEAFERICPYCQQMITTKVKERFNCFTCIFSIFVLFGMCCLLCMTGCQTDSCKCGKNCCSCKCNCKCWIDVTHYCPNCGQIIGISDSCIRLCPCCARCC